VSFKEQVTHQWYAWPFVRMNSVDNCFGLERFMFEGLVDHHDILHFSSDHVFQVLLEVKPSLAHRKPKYLQGTSQSWWKSCLNALGAHHFPPSLSRPHLRIVTIINPHSISLVFHLHQWYWLVLKVDNRTFTPSRPPPLKISTIGTTRSETLLIPSAFPTTLWGH